MVLSKMTNENKIIKNRDEAGVILTYTTKTVSGIEMEFNTLGEAKRFLKNNLLINSEVAK